MGIRPCTSEAPSRPVASPPRPHSKRALFKASSNSLLITLSRTAPPQTHITRLLIASKLIIGGQSSWRSRSPALRSLAAEVNFDNFDRQQFDPFHQKFIFVDNNAILGGKSSFWSSTIRSFADNLHFDHNRRQLDPLRRKLILIGLS